MTAGTSASSRAGKVLSAAKRPNADRLQLCVVDVGEGDSPHKIVCGAWNFGAGAAVAVLLPDAKLPDGLVLERRKLRGEMSEGMILSERELQLGQDHTGIIVLDEGEPGTPLADLLTLQDVVLDLEVTGDPADLCTSPSMASPAKWRRCFVWTSRRRRVGIRDHRRRTGQRVERGLRRLPAVHQAALPRRPHRRVAAGSALAWTLRACGQ